MSNQLKYIPWQGWEEVDKIGEGSFGSVYLVKHTLIEGEEYAALKVITVPRNKNDIKSMRAEGKTDESITQSIKDQAGNVQKEYESLCELQGSPNIVQCKMVHPEQHSDAMGYDIYILMELLTPLLDRIDELMGVETQIIRFGSELCSALIACENKGILHRDIKPENVFVSKDGVYKLGDFGIARYLDHSTYATQGIGTPSYMAPEVANGEKYSKQADIYSLGIMLYWLLNRGRIPFLPLPPKDITALDREKAIKRRNTGEKIPEPENGSKELKQIVLKACAFDPKDRYQSAREMQEDLARLSGACMPESDPVLQPDSSDLGRIEERTDGTLIKNTPHSDSGKTVGPAFNPISRVNEDDSGGTIGSKPYDRVKKIIEEDNDQGQNRGMLTAIAVIAVIGIALILLLFIPGKETPPKKDPSVAQHQHEWKEATYNSPKTCTACGKTEGSNKTPAARLHLADIVEYSKASSAMAARGNEDFGPENMYDQNELTYWVEGTDGAGIGESATFYFDGTYAIKEITTLSGSQYQEDSTYFTKHNRPSKIRLNFSDGTNEVIYLQDTPDYQTIILSKYHYAEYVEMTIEEVYAGTHWNETPFSEVDFAAYNP